MTKENTYEKNLLTNNIKELVGNKDVSVGIYDEIISISLSSGCSEVCCYGLTEQSDNQSTIEVKIDKVIKLNKNRNDINDTAKDIIVVQPMLNFICDENRVEKFKSLATAYYNS